MKIRSKPLAGCALVLLVATGARAAETSATAHALYESNCIRCHGSEIYTREGRMVTSYEGLERQVQRCETALGLRWFDEDIQDVAAYLNDRFYRFEP